MELSRNYLNEIKFKWKFLEYQKKNLLSKNNKF